MYNRYVPQSDGSYRRNRMEDPSPRQRPEPPPKPQPQPEPQIPCQDPEPPKQLHSNQNVGSFFKQLLPPNFDSGDLIIVLLLLLLAGDCQEDKTTAMLTLVMYLFMS